MISEIEVKRVYPGAILESKSSYGGMHRVVVPLTREQMKEYGLRKPQRVIGGWCTSEPGAWFSAMNWIKLGRS